MQKRLDSLGRVVIPQEFRKQLNLKSNDFVEIDCTKDAIIIKKSILKNKFDCIIKTVLNPLYETYKCNIIMTDKDKVLYSKDKSLIGLNISSILQNYFELIPEKYEELYFEKTNQLKLAGKIYLIPILEDGYKIGCVILKGNYGIKNTELVFIYNLINN